MTEKLTMIELFSGIGAQEKALRQLNIPYEITHTCDCDKDAVLSYAAMRTDFESQLNSYNFPSVEDMISDLQNKNVGYDFMKGKHTITTRTPINKLKQYYLADKLSKNLGDIGKVERLPYADMVTYSFPCTDLSVAGKGEGMQNKCDACGHSWPIDFSNADEVLICPNCGEKVSSSTRSGLLGQVQRLLAVAYENNELPKYLLLENVKNLVGKKFVHQFNAWVKWLDSIGYNTYYQVLNAKHYGIPQNRERVFAVSIRKDIDNGEFKFPDKIPLNIRLKDILEKNVDEKYYLPDERIDKILNSTFMQEKKRIQMKDVCDTLLARDWKDPKCVQVEDLFIVASRGRNPENPSDRTVGSPTEQRLEPNFSGCTNTLTSVQKDNYVAEPQVLRAERTEYGKAIRKQYEAGEVYEKIGNMRELAPRTDGVSNTITTLLKDNYVYEPQIVIGSMQANSYIGDGSISPSLTAAMGMGGGQIPMVGYVTEPVVYDDYNSRISSDQDAINTLTTNCGVSAERNGVKILEPIVCEERRDEGIRLFKDDCVGTLRTIDACGDKRVLVPDINPQLVGGIGEKNFGKQYRQGNRVYDSDAIAMALNAQPVGNAGGYSYLYTVEEEASNIKWRIRKLTAKECFRLMNFTDQDCDRAAHYVSSSAQYKQCGNSIVVSCLIAIMSSLFIKNGYRADIWTQYMLNYADGIDND
jgi:DNA (cytosine-5)-methyltransferase 1